MFGRTLLGCSVQTHSAAHGDGFGKEPRSKFLIAAAGGVIRDEVRRRDGCQSVAVLCVFESLDGFFKKGILVLRYFAVDHSICLLRRIVLAYPAAETCIPSHSI